MPVSNNTIVITSRGPKGEKGAAVTVDGEAITSFSTVAVTGSTNVVADVANDTFTLTGGTNVTLSTSGSTITINATDTNTNTTYDLASAQNASNVDLTLTGSDATTDTVTLVAGSNVTLTDDGSNNVTVASTDTNTTYTLDTAQSGSNATITITGSDASTDTITLAAGSGITLTEAGDTITIASTGGGGGSSITVIDESTTLTTGVTQFTFTGAGVTATEPVADQVTVTIPGESNSFGVFNVGGTSLSADTANDTLSVTTTPSSAVNLTALAVGANDTLTIDAYIQNETAPTLGANLDVAAYKIYTTTTNGSVVVHGDGTGVGSLGSNAVNNNVNCSPGLIAVRNNSTQSEIRLYEESDVNYVSLKAPTNASLSADLTFTLPSSYGTSSQFLQTDGAGGLTWASGGSATSLSGQKLEYIVSSTALSSAGDYEGLVLKVGDAGNTLTAGNVYYFNATQTDWVAASNAAEATAKGVLGIALGTSGTADGVLIQGVYYYADAAGVTGDVLFLGTGGAMTATAPTTDGEILRVLGQNIDNNIVMFQPSQDFIELGAAAGTTGLNDLSDVTITGTPTANQVLVYSTGTSSFENVDLAIVNDTTPQLGGNLDINGNSIVSTSNGNIAITPDGTGAVVLDGLSYPTADGAANQPLVTNGSGAISFGSTVKATLQGNVNGADLDVKIETNAATTAGDAEGVVVYFGTGATTAGKVYTYSSGAWVAVSAATGGEATTKGLLGMAIDTSPSSGMLLYGVGFINHDHGGAAGSILYVSDGVTTGEVTATQPTGPGEYVRVVGHAITANGVSGSKVFFSPSQDWIEIA